MRFNLRSTLFSVLAIAASLTSFPATSCGMVFGDDWAFIISGPENWEFACGSNALPGTAATLWPAGSAPSEAKSLLYVTVSKKIPASLAEFVQDEQHRFSLEAKDVRISEIDLSKQKLRQSTMAFQLAPPSPARQELIAYIEGPTAHYIVVMTSLNAAELEQQRPVFLDAVEAFVAMTRKQ